MRQVIICQYYKTKYLKVFLFSRQVAEFMAQLEGSENGINTSQWNVRLTTQASEGIQARLGMSQWVELEAVGALVALTMEFVRFLDSVATL